MYNVAGPFWLLVLVNGTGEWDLVAIVTMWHRGKFLYGGVWFGFGYHGYFVMCCREPCGSGYNGTRDWDLGPGCHGVHWAGLHARLATGEEEKEVEESEQNCSLLDCLKTEDSLRYSLLPHLPASGDTSSIPTVSSSAAVTANMLLVLLISVLSLLSGE